MNNTEALMKDALVALRVAGDRIAYLERLLGVTKSLGGESREIGIVRDQTSTVVGGGKGTSLSPRSLDTTKLFSSPSIKADVAKAKADRAERERR